MKFINQNIHIDSKLNTLIKKQLKLKKKFFLKYKDSKKLSECNICKNKTMFIFV